MQGRSIRCDGLPSDSLEAQCRPLLHNRGTAINKEHRAAGFMDFEMFILIL